MTSESLLLREIYSEAEAARLLRLPPSTLHYWLEGRDYRGRHYSPILREKPIGVSGLGGQRTLTWAEFIGGRVATVSARSPRADGRTPRVHRHPPRQFRRALPAGDDATLDRRPVTGHRSAADVAAARGPVAVRADDRARLLLPPAQAFLDRVEFDDEVATRWHPALDPQSTVIIDPDTRFGKLSVGGVSTEVVWEYDQDGYSTDEIAAEFALITADVDWALSYERAAHAS